MEAKFELIATGSYEEALREGQKIADEFAKGARDIRIKATKMKKPKHWKVILTYKRDSEDSTSIDFKAFFNI